MILNFLSFADLPCIFLLWWDICTLIHLKNWVICFLVKFWNFIMCCIYKSYNRYVTCNRVILLCGLSFHSLNGVSWRTEVFNFDEVHFFLFYRLWFLVIAKKGFPGNSAGKQSACNAGERPQFNFGLGRSTGEGMGYALQYSWASLVAQLVNNPPAMLDTWVQSLGWEDPMEESMAIHSNILAWRIPMERGAWQATFCGAAKTQIWLSD